MNVERLFYYTLNDLERRTNQRDEYEVLMAAALLRKLLLDSERLMDKVNQIYRLKVRFRISDVSDLERWLCSKKPQFWSLEDALDPDSGVALGHVALEATRDQFINRRIIIFEGEQITVRDVIDQLANVEGAVHSGRPKNQRERVFQEAGKFFSRDGLPGVVSQVRLIGRITVRGLGPLKDAVTAGGKATLASVDRDGSAELR